MTNREIDQRVAVGMGYCWITNRQRSVYMFTKRGSLSKWYVKEHGIVEVDASEVPDGWLGDYASSPNYTTDPKSANLVFNELTKECDIDESVHLYAGSWLSSCKISGRSGTAGADRPWAHVTAETTPEEGPQWMLVRAVAFLVRHRGLEMIEHGLFRVPDILNYLSACKETA